MSTSRWYKPFTLVLLLLISCGKSLPSFENMDLNAWKDDKLACGGKRTAMIETMQEQTEKLLALNEQEIISLLGKPDENELYKRNQKFFYYYLDPSPSCTNSESIDPKKLVIRFNAVGLAKEAAVE